MNALFTLSKRTLHDLLRERILYNVLFVGLFLLFLGYLAALLVYGRQDRVMLDFGVMVNAFSIYAVSASAGARLIQTEIDQRTAYLVLARPVSRTVFFTSKWFGLIAFTALNLLLLCAVLALGLKMTLGAFTYSLVQSMTLLWVESLMVAAFSLFIAQFLRPGLTVMVTLTYFFLSHNHEQLQLIQFPLFTSLTPDGTLFLLDTRAYYDLPLTALEWANRAGYGILWAILYLLLGNAVFYRRTI